MSCDLLFILFYSMSWFLILSFPLWLSKKKKNFFGCFKSISFRYMQFSKTKNSLICTYAFY